MSPLRQEEREVAQPGYGKEEQESVRACSRLETSGDGGGTHLTAPSPPSSSSEAMRGETRETWPDANGKRQGSAPSASPSVRRLAMPDRRTDGRTDGGTYPGFVAASVAAAVQSSVALRRFYS